MSPITVREAGGEVVVARRLGAGGALVRVGYVAATAWLVATDLARLGDRPLFAVAAQSALLVVLAIAVAGYGIFRVAIRPSDRVVGAWRFPRLPFTVPIERVRIDRSARGAKMVFGNGRAFFLFAIREDDAEGAALLARIEAALARR